MKEVHLFILWEHARYKEKEILEDIRKNFKILGMYNIAWDKEIFSKSLSRFYGTNLPKNSGKEQHCGNGSFLLIVVEVDNPKYEQRDTLSKGMQTVNVNMFDKKMYYRELTGGGHRVHATNSEKETNHDLTLLLGKSIEDYLKEIDNKKEPKIIDLKQDLIGTNGFKTVKEMFYVLNNCIDYAVLRNYETLPDEIYVNEHNDIDIICDSYENAAFILNAEKVFSEEYRVHYKVEVENKIAFFDLRYIGDNYYYYKIEKDLIQNRIYNEKGFYTVSNEDYYYTLLYHALLHKPIFSEDYQNRLSQMKNDEVRNIQKAIQTLNDWLLEKGYCITIPVDKSVLFNRENAKKFDKILEINQLEIEELTENLKKENKLLEEELQNIKNSALWKITNPIRKLITKTKAK